MRLTNNILLGYFCLYAIKYNSLWFITHIKKLFIPAVICTVDLKLLFLGQHISSKDFGAVL